MTLAILYSFRRCPYAMRARMALAYAAIEVEHREVVLARKPASMLAYSGKGTVPVLVVSEPNSSIVIDESLDIMRWALAQSDLEYWWYQRSEQDQTVIDQLIDENDHSFKSCLDRYKYADRHPENIELFYRQQGEKFLQKLELRLAGKNYLVDEIPSLADIAIVPFVRQFAHVNRDWFYASSYKNLQQWLDGFLNSALFIGIMKKHPEWQDE